MMSSLALIPGHGLRLQIERNMAFVYDPIFLESPDTVYLIDWGSKLENQNIGDYMDRNTQNLEGVLHTFLFVLARVSKDHLLMECKSNNWTERMVLHWSTQMDAHAGPVGGVADDGREGA
jgi:hypothetical protein